MNLWKFMCNNYLQCIISGDTKFSDLFILTIITLSRGFLLDGDNTYVLNAPR